MANRVFNRMQRHVFRKRISWVEVSSGVVVLVLLVGTVAWVFSRGDDYDPGERDIAFAVLESQIVEDRLYKQPFQPWREPGQRAAEGPRLGPFPASLLDGPWQVATRLQQFTPDNLYVKINGAAEQYIRFGNVGLHYIDLRHVAGAGDGEAQEQAEIGIELYDQGSFANGLGIFGAQRDPERALLQEGPLHYYPTAIGAIGVLGRWFFKVTGSSESDVVRSKTRQILSALAELPAEQAATPYGYRVLNEGLGISLGELAYQPQNAFQYDFATDFWFGRLDPGSRVQAFIHQAADPALAAELFEQLLAEQLYDFELVDEGENRTLLHHRFLESYFTMALEGPLIYGIENAPSVEVAEQALYRLEDATLFGDDA